MLSNKQQHDGGLKMNSCFYDINWIYIPGGKARIGSSLEEIEEAQDYWRTRLLSDSYKDEFKNWLLKEYPINEVYLKPYKISDIPVTNGLYLEYCEQTSQPFPESISDQVLGGGHENPVWGVTIEEALSFCEWLSSTINKNITIPTEAQWEFAARGETRRIYPWGNNFSQEFCNTYESKIEKTTPVRKYEKGKSYYGLYDMGGNIEEWVHTKYDAYPNGVVIDDDLLQILGKDYFILKGGSFARGGDLCRVARRHGRHPNPEFRFTGFRLAISL